MITLDDELARQYRSECQEHLACLEEELLAIERDGAAIDGERVARAFRAVHSIKGGAIFLELPLIHKLAHQAEDVLALIRSRCILHSSSRITLLLRTADQLSELIQRPGAGGSSAASETLAALKQLAGKLRNGETSAPAPISTRRRLRMLMVEDDFTSRLLLETFLSRYGDCHTADNGCEGVDAFRGALARGEEFDLICMDIMMPAMDGHQAVREVRAMEKRRGIHPTCGVKIIMTTTVDDVREVILCFQELCDEYLMKPIDLAKLVGHMRSYHLIE